jgi:hypothetical protein
MFKTKEEVLNTYKALWETYKGEAVTRIENRVQRFERYSHDYVISYIQSRRPPNNH